MNSEPEDVDAAMELAEQFLARLRRGERPEVSEFVARRPDLEERLRRILDAILALEAAVPEAETSPAPPSPQVIGPYRIVREIGRGGMGIVYEAIQQHLGRRVALKVMTSALHASQNAVDRFRREAMVASRLAHPGICTVHDAGIIDGVPFIAMALVEGETLAERLGHRASEVSTLAPDTRCEGRPEATVPEGSGIRTHGPAPRDEIDTWLKIAESAARALHVAHEAGILHRDLKPGNIMVTPEDEPVVLDFGLARELDGGTHNLTATGDIVGTPAYMAPEQIANAPLDRRVDVWSLGVTLYEALGGQKPFNAPTRELLYLAIAREEPAPLRRLNPAVPRDVEAVVGTAIEKDAARRYATALDLAEDLARVRAKEPIRARPPPAWTRGLRWIARHPTESGLTAAALLLVIASGTFLAYFLSTREDIASARRESGWLRQEELLAQGILHLGWQEPRRALQLFERAAAEEPTPESTVGVALALFEDARFPEALEVLDRNRELESRAPALGLIRANLLKRMGRLDEAEAMSAKLPAPSSAFDHFVRGLAFQDEGINGNRSAAQRSFDDLTDAIALSGRPRQILHVLRVRAAGALGDPDRLARCAASLSRLWPDSAITWQAIGMAEETAGNPKGAAAAFLRATQLEPANVDAWTSLTEARRKMGDLDGAVAAAETALQLAPGSAESHFSLGIAHHARREFEAATAAYEKALAISPALTVARLNLGHLARKSGDLDRAATLLEEARWRAPKDAGVAYALGVVRFERGDAEGALDLFRASVALRMTEAKYHHAVANVLIALDRESEAVEAARAACRLAPEDSGYAFTLGCALQEGPAPREAEAAFREALRIDSRHAEAHALLGRVLMGGFRFQEARDLLQQSLALQRIKPDLLPRVQAWLEECVRQLDMAERRAVILAGGAADREELEPLARAAAKVGKPGEAAALFERILAAAEAAPEATTAPSPWRCEGILAALEAGAAWRSTARAWLESEVAAWEEAVRSGAASSRDANRAWSRIQVAAGFEAALAEAFPKAESSRWQALASRIEALVSPDR